MKIFYDGNNPLLYNKVVQGFTSNASFAGKSEYTRYIDYIQNYIQYTGNLPCSFQVTTEDEDDILRQARVISSMSENIFIKIPIIKSNGSYNLNIIKYIINNKIKVNITALYTIEHIDALYEILNNNLQKTIVSVFAGSIMDAGLDPVPTISHAVKIFSKLNNIEIIWAGCQTNFNIVQAKLAGSHIITVPDSIMIKMDRINKDLNLLAMNRVDRFILDAKNLII